VTFTLLKNHGSEAEKELQWLSRRKTMSAEKYLLYASPETYISGMMALSIPDEGRIGGDWHFAAALCRKGSLVQSAGSMGTLTNTNAIFGDRLVENKSGILEQRGINVAGSNVYCALHPRAIADLLHHSLKQNIFPAHVSLDGGIFEEEIEFELLDSLMKEMIPHLSQSQLERLLRWKGSHFCSVRDGV
ncbi:MAG TPA: hypothetical protein PLS03_18725, partial [Terrimicrobiaceae bacterium]|nr:hypothetical protein [Terrimicrobiaceae bacterium]